METYDPLPGTDIDSASLAAVQRANKLGEAVQLKFNGVAVVVTLACGRGRVSTAQLRAH